MLKMLPGRQLTVAEEALLSTRCYGAILIGLRWCAESNRGLRAPAAAVIEGVVNVAFK
jgi:hypothetical protein